MRLFWHTALLLLVMRADGLGDEPKPSKPLLSRGIQQYEAAMAATDRNARIAGFRTAEQLFRQSIDEMAQDARGAAVYVNLGNAALQAEHVGPAIWAFRRALRCDPANLQAQQNLQFARSLIPQVFQRDQTTDMVTTLFFWNQMYSRSLILGIGACLFLVAAMAFAYGWAAGLAWVRNLALLPALGWLLCLASTWFVAEAPGAEAVVVADEVILRSADSENSPQRLSEAMPSGVEVRVLRERERWTEVELPGGRSGWVLRSAVQAV